jgi:hypothetical protein
VYLRSRFDSVYVVVPDYAKSAATLLALGADSIIMGPSAELGPLDMQEAREGEIHLRSALDTANSIETLFQRAITNALMGGGHILQHTRLSREKTLTSVLQFAAAFFQPLMEQIDPVAVYSASSGLMVTVEYGARLLQARLPGVPGEQLREQVGALVTGYPTHGFIIDRKEAERILNLPIEPIESYDLRADVGETYLNQQRAQVNLIRVVTLSELRSQEKAPHDDEDGSTKDNRNRRSNGAGALSRQPTR